MSKTREKPARYRTSHDPESLLPRSSFIRIRGARVHNLQGVDVDIPHGKLTVITGVSGSGKSSLAFDTLYAEGQRQYIESLSAYARQFLDQIPRPDVDSVDGLQPTLCIDQKTSSTHPRSTVATVTEIHDYLRLLYARAGVPHCTGCGQAITHQSADMILGWLKTLAPETKVVLLAPMIRGRRGTHREVFEQMAKNGWLRARVNGEIHSLDQLPELSPRKLHTIEAVVDRLVIREGNEHRLAESATTALRFGGGVMVALVTAPESKDWTERLLSTLFACPQCGKSFQELEPRSFSFNSPYGACAACDGLGYTDGQVCEQCLGGRLKPESLAVTLLDRSIANLSATSIADLIDFFSELVDRLPTMQQAIGRPIAIEVAKRLRFLDRVGVGYLSLDRPAGTLSGGELQRVRLATSIGSGLVGVCYVLDEPSIGLHPCDNDRLIESIRDLQRQGNTIVVVEHDESMMWASDHLIDMGPGAGPRGGLITSQGTPIQVAADPASLTGNYLSKTLSIPFPAVRRPADVNQSLRLVGATTHNLKNVDVVFPLGLLIGVTGVSGSGKSSLINDTLVPAITTSLRATGRAVAVEEDPTRPCDAKYQKLIGIELVDKLISIDQSPIGRGSRSCPATYAGVLDEIRKVFAATRESKQRGFKSNRFSFNAADGRCDLCKGQGSERIEMNFLSDLLVTCSRCGGKRFNRQTLMVRFKGKNVADVLDMTIDEAALFFENFPKIKRLLSSLVDIGLGYVQLGQPSTTLSGGEAQRIKLGTELARTQTGRTVYILDEPTTGLHFADVARLLSVLQRLVDAGNTVIVIEHNLDVIAACDWIIDIGPVGGTNGGYIMAQGTPQSLVAMDGNATGHYLGKLFAESR
jgi:excinuclease ABC subunit A